MALKTGLEGRERCTSIRRDFGRFRQIPRGYLAITRVFGQEVDLLETMYWSQWRTSHLIWDSENLSSSAGKRDPFISPIAEIFRCKLLGSSFHLLAVSTRRFEFPLRSDMSALTEKTGCGVHEYNVANSKIFFIVDTVDIYGHF